MLDALKLAVLWGVGTLGALSSVVLGAAALYMLAGLWRQRRAFAVGVAGASLALAFTPAGVWVVSIGCGLVVASQSLCYVVFAARALLRSNREGPGWVGPWPTVTVIVPAKDEEAVIESTLRSLDGLDYPSQLLDIVVIDDGSIDTTLSRVRAAAKAMRYPTHVMHFDRSAGKARRLNDLLWTLDTELVLLLDADHWVPADLVRTMLHAFGDRRDIACVQAASQLRNGKTNVLTRSLEMEYLFRCKGIYPGKPVGVFVGSGGMFRRSALLEVGGFDASMLTEDVELSYRLYKQGYSVRYDDAACSYDLGPVDFRNFFNQRHRWMRGLFQALLLHARAAQAPAPLRKVLPYFVQFTLDGFGALCLCVLQAYFSLHVLGVVTFRLAPVIYAMMLSCSFAFSVGFVRARRLDNLLFLGLVPLYMVAHTIPMAWALIDSYVLGKPVVWVKTERGSERPASIGLSGGRA
jgi:cellulose synthase/poly-beta-1,6-N-acetylglucosamine synthase-like glycosyltransferase